MADLDRSIVGDSLSRAATVSELRPRTAGYSRPFLPGPPPNADPVRENGQWAGRGTGSYWPIAATSGRPDTGHCFGQPDAERQDSAGITGSIDFQLRRDGKKTG